MTAIHSARGRALVDILRSSLATLDSLDPVEADAIVSALVADLQARRPMSVAPLGVLGPPTERIADPREDGMGPPVYRVNHDPRFGRIEPKDPEDYGEGRQEF